MMRVVERWYLAPGVTVHAVEVGRLRGRVFVPAAHHGAPCLPADASAAPCPYSWPAPARYSTGCSPGAVCRAILVGLPC